jgi:ribosomal protein S18 acetylase RimI-like enzyme
MRIRDAVVADAGGIARVHVDAWRGAYAGIVPEGYLARLSKEEREKRWSAALEKSTESTRVAVSECDDVLGWTDFGPSRDADGESLKTGTEAGSVGELYAIYLDPPHWGRGIGRDLLQDALAILRDRGFDSITLWVLEDNTRTRRFYEKAGFVFDGTSKTITVEGKELVEIRYRIDL